MALSEKITCDICSIEHGPANHWLMYYKSRYHNEIAFLPWEDHYNDYGHLCGQACATKLLSRSIETWKIEAPTP